MKFLYIMRLFLLIICCIVSCCACSPFVITHEDGKVPKVKIELPEGKGKIKVRGKHYEIKFIWVKKF